MDWIDVSSFDIAIVLPILVVVVIILVIARSLKLPESYYKDKQLREAMMKRRAEKADLERMEELRSQMMFMDEDEHGGIEEGNDGAAEE